MKILFAAPITFDDTTFFISTYMVHLSREAAGLGHEVKVLQTTDTKMPVLLDHLRKDRTIRNSFSEEYLTFRKHFGFIADYPNDLYLSQQISEEVKDFNPDVLFIYLINTYNLSSLIKNLKKEGIKVVTWLGLHPSKVSPGVHKILKNCDHTFIYDRSYVKYYEEELNITNTQTLPLGCSVSYYDSINPDSDFIKDNKVNICFSGMYDERRKNFLEHISDLGLGIWSWNFSDHQTPLGSNYRGVVYGDDLIKVMKSAKIGVNIHREFEVSGGNYRLFEIPASKTFQIVDDKKSIGDYFRIGEEIITFKDKKELRDKVQYYLKNEKEREEIAMASYKRIKKDHSLKNRVERMMEIIAC